MHKHDHVGVFWKIIICSITTVDISALRDLSPSKIKMEDTYPIQSINQEEKLQEKN